MWGESQGILLMAHITEICKTKAGITGMSLGGVALLVIFTFLYPSIVDNDTAIGELQITEGILSNTLQNQNIQLNNLANGQDEINTKLSQIIIILCTQADTSICP